MKYADSETSDGSAYGDGENRAALDDEEENGSDFDEAVELDDTAIYSDMDGESFPYCYGKLADIRVDLMKTPDSKSKRPKGHGSVSKRKMEEWQENPDFVRRGKALRETADAMLAKQRELHPVLMPKVPFGKLSRSPCFFTMMLIQNSNFARSSDPTRLH